jgi:hypothetical protein
MWEPRRLTTLWAFTGLLCLFTFILTFLKELEDVLEEEIHKIPIEIVQNLYRVHSKKDCGCIEGKRSNTILIKKCKEYP